MNRPPWLYRAAAWTALVALTHTHRVPAAEPSAQASREANTVLLDATAAANLGIETAEAEEVTFEETFPVLGRIEVLPGKRAVVSSRIPGRVKQVMAYPDRRVNQGDPLVVVESRQPGDPPPEITLTAPISGFVTDLEAVPGQPVSPDRPLLAIVDLSVVHGIAQVPEYLADRLLPGQKVRFTAPGWPGEVWDSKIEHIGVEVDTTNGTLEVACHLKNEGTWLRPGMRGEFQMITASRPDVLAVPRAALQGDPVNRFVFVSDIELPNAFVRTPVVTGIENDRYVEIRQGLFPGEPVVVRGGYPLAFAGKGTVSLKEALDAAHGHAHNEDGSEMTGQSAHADEPKAAAGHSHAASSPVPRFNLLTGFFAGTTGILLILLIAQSLRTRRTSPQPGSPHA
jgi:multidrug efflux pump subunit AcrA (membrane-fusion protein)